MLVVFKLFILALISANVCKSDDMKSIASAQLLDTNGDGIIDRAELVAALAKVDSSGGNMELSESRVTPPRKMSEIEPGVEVGADGAYVDCPCIDHVLDAKWAALMSIHVASSSDAVILNASDRILSRDYGSTHCRAWDEGGNSARDECKMIGNAPEYCSHMWCFVNSSQCRRSFLHVSSIFLGFVASYTTCGNIGLTTLANLDFETVLPIYAIDLPEFGLSTRPAQIPPDGPIGLRMMTIFASHVVRSMNLPPGAWKYRALSNASKLVYSSPYTACVHDVDLGNIGVCFGDWWFTSARAHMNFNFIPVFSTSMMLMVRKVKVKEDSFWDQVKKAFAPFSWQLWLLIIGMLTFASVVMAIVDKDKVNFDRSLHCQGCGTLEKSVYESALSFASFSNSYTPVTPAGKVLGLGIAFFITITGASFTANSAQFLISEAQRPKQFKDLMDLLDAGHKVCVDRDLLQEISAAYPILSSRAVLKAPGQEINGLLGAECTGAIVSEFELSSVDPHVVCDVEFIGSSIHQYPTGYYTTPELGALLKYYVSIQLSNGTWTRIKMETMREPACGDERDESLDVEDNVLKPSHMYGNIFILMTSCAVAIVMRSCIFAEKEIEGNSRRHLDERRQENNGESLRPPVSAPLELHPVIDNSEATMRTPHQQNSDMLPSSMLSALALRVETLEGMDHENASTSLSSVHSDLALRIDRIDKKIATINDDKVLTASRLSEPSACSSSDLALRMDHLESMLKAGRAAVRADYPHGTWQALAGSLHVNNPQCDLPESSLRSSTDMC